MSDIKTVKKGRSVLYTDGTTLGKRVTKIIDNLDKPALKFWTMKVSLDYMGKEVLELMEKPDRPIIDKIIKDAKKAPFAQSEEALDIGSTVHELIECFLKGDTIFLKPYADEVKRGYGAFVEWWYKQKAETIEIEKKVMYVFEDALYGVVGFGGTLDWYGILNGASTIIDWKTSKAIYEPSMPLQLSAYLAAIEQMNEKEVEGGAMIGRLGKQVAEFEPKFYDRDKLLKYFECFKSLFRYAEGIEQIKK